MTCEKCWDDAYRYFIASTGHESQTDIYARLIKERPPCTPQEQAGPFWSEEKQCDVRTNGATHGK